MSNTCGVCEGPCVCAELDAFLDETQETRILRGTRMRKDMFEVGFGQSLQQGDQVLNLVVHRPGVEPDSPQALMMSFAQAEAQELIRLLIATYRHVWVEEDD